MSKVITERECNKCRTVKPIDQFNKDPYRWGGHSYRCRACSRLHTLSYYYLSKNDPKYIESRRKRNAEHRKKYPLKYKARYLADNRRNKLVKSSCENCGTSERLQMHHPDYTKPIEVITLCVRCHTDLHKGVA